MLWYMTSSPSASLTSLLVSISWRSSCSGCSSRICSCRRAEQQSRHSPPGPTLWGSSSNMLKHTVWKSLCESKLNPWYFKSSPTVKIKLKSRFWKMHGTKLQPFMFIPKKWFTFSLDFIDKKNCPVQKEHWITSRQMRVLYLVLKQHYIWTIQ